MICRKQLVLTGYRVQYVDLREPKPRTPQELIHVADSQWVYAMGLTGQNILAHIQEQYERVGYKVFSVSLSSRSEWWNWICASSGTILSLRKRHQQMWR